MHEAAGSRGGVDSKNAALMKGTKGSGQVTRAGGHSMKSGSNRAGETLQLLREGQKDMNASRCNLLPDAALSHP